MRSPSAIGRLYGCPAAAGNEGSGAAGRGLAGGAFHGYSIIDLFGRLGNRLPVPLLLLARTPHLDEDNFKREITNMTELVDALTREAAVIEVLAKTYRAKM